MTAEYRIVTRDERDRLGEGPFWDVAEGALYWVDILHPRVNRLTLVTGRIDSWPMPEMTGWIIRRRDRDGFLAGLTSGVKAVTFEPFAIAPFADLPDEPEGNRMNDAVADAHGRLWAGTMPVTCDRPSGALYRIYGDVTCVDTGYHVANGPAISPDGRWLFHTNSVASEIYRFPLHDDGSLGPRELWLRFEPEWGSPDGMTFDAEGGLWIAHWGGGRISRFMPDCGIDRAIDLPASQITSMAFAGPRLDRLFVTSASDGVDEPEAGCLFEVDPGVQGLLPDLVAG